MYKIVPKPKIPLTDILILWQFGSQTWTLIYYSVKTSGNMVIWCLHIMYIVLNTLNIIAPTK